jgi:hypothetical protein
MRGRSPQSQMDGFVYFIEAIGVGVIKIGYSGNVAERLSNLDIASPVPLVLMCAAPGSVRDERALHAFFHEHRIRGEWFARSAVVTLGKRLALSKPAEQQQILEDIRQTVLGRLAA